MKNIVVLIDFTGGSAVALKQAISLSKHTHALVTGLHIVSSPEKVKHAEEELDTFISKYDGEVTVGKMVVVGSLIQAAEDALRKINPDLVMVCTHGVKGMYQYLFGAQILKLVQAIPFPCLVVHENKGIDLTQEKSILLPIGPHPDFMLKTHQTAALAKAFGANIIIYRIDRPGNDFQKILIQNEEDAKKYFTEQQIPYTAVLEDIEVVSVGYSRQTINFAVKHNIGIMSLMANLSPNDQMFGYSDKENFLVNEEGISVLCCN
ncbi:MAG: universal stress protein [Bacteroidota bacterium]